MGKPVLIGPMRCINCQKYLLTFEELGTHEYVWGHVLEFWRADGSHALTSKVGGGDVPYMEKTSLEKLRLL